MTGRGQERKMPGLFLSYVLGKGIYGKRQKSTMPVKPEEKEEECRCRNYAGL